MKKDSIGIAVVGAGYWGPNLIRNLCDDSRVAVKWVCETSEARVSDLKSKFGKIRFTTELKEVLGDRTVDAVIVSTPTGTHFAVAKQCLLAGKHLFIEKPMCTSSEECHELNAIAASRNLKIMTGHIFLFNPGVLYLRELIAGGTIGKILYIHSKRLNLGPIRRDVDAMWDLASHDIAICNYLLDDQPDTVSATGTAHVNPKNADVVFLTLKYPDGVLVSLHVSWLDPRKTRQTVIVGTRKMVVFDDLDPVGSVHVYDKSVSVAPYEDATSIMDFKAVIQDGTVSVPKLPIAEPLRNECRALVDWIIDGKMPISTGETGVSVVEVLEAGSESLRRAGTEVPVERRPYVVRGAA